jgi:hypothetical protein
VGIDQLVRFFVVEPTYPVLNSRFGMCIIFMSNYFLVIGDICVDNKASWRLHKSQGPLVQSFKCVHRGSVYVYFHRGESTCLYDI